MWGKISLRQRTAVLRHQLNPFRQGIINTTAPQSNWSPYLLQEVHEKAVGFHFVLQLVKEYQGCEREPSTLYKKKTNQKLVNIRTNFPVFFSEDLPLWTVISQYLNLKDSQKPGNE